MGWSIPQETASTVWALARSQHGVVTRRQLIDLGLTPRAIEHRRSKGRLHPVWRGVYALGRPQLARRGVWMAAVLSCGPEAALSHGSAAALRRIAADEGRVIHVSVPRPVDRDHPGIVVHRRTTLDAADVTRHDGIPVTTPVCTLIDLAACWPVRRLEAAVNEADKLGLIDIESLRSSLDELRRRPGAAVLKQLLDRHTFALTDSELERRFLPIVRRAGLPRPKTGVHVNGFKVDFFWSDLGLVVETDGLRYHRTPLQQARDRVRDQAHLAAGHTPLRFTHAQVAFEPERVGATLGSVARRLATQR
jgi:very-short-patch-repair endonuclease/predicted transcriptional regulator of viral defense system